MPCRIEISKEYRDKYGLPEDMPEADFYAWLANGGLESIAADADIKFSFIKIDDTKFKESLGIRKKISKKIKVTIKALNAMIYGAESAGVKAGQKISEKRINMLQQAAKDFLNEVGVENTVRISTAIGKIRNQNHLAKFFTLVNEKKDLDARLYEIEQIDKKLNIIQKMRKSIKRLNVNNIKFIKELNLPSSYEISDLKKYGELLDEYIDKRRGGKATTNVEKELNDFIAGEKAYIDAYKEQIENIKELIKYAQWSEEYRQLKEKGVFDGTDIKSEEDWLLLKDNIAEQEGQESEIIANEEKLKKIEERATAKKEAISAVIQNINNFIEENEAELEDYFKEYSTIDNQVLLSDIKAIDLSKLSYNKLILLNNTLQNILYSNDFVGVGVFTSEGRLSRKEQSLFYTLGKRINLKSNKVIDKFKSLKEDDKRTLIQTITDVAEGGESLNAALDFIIGSWDGLIGRNREQFNNIFSQFDRLKNELSRNTEELLKSTVRIDAYAFINQWFKSDSKEEQIAYVKLRVERIASQYAKNYESNLKGRGLTASKKLKIEMDEEGLKALASFGVITDLKFSNGEVTYKIADNIDLDTIKNKLNEKEQKVYDFVISTYEFYYPEFKKGVNNNLSKEFDEIQNYYPSYTYVNEDDAINAISSTSEANPLDLGKEFTPFSKTKSNTKNRSKTLAPDKFDYKMGLSENFSRGLWMTLMVSQGSNEMADMSNMLNSNLGLSRLIGKETGLNVEEVNILKNQLKEKVDSDMVFGAVSTDIENAIKNELSKLLNNATVGFILKDWTAFIKQGLAPIVTSFAFNPEITSQVVYGLLRENTSNAIDFLVRNSSIQSRLAAYEQSSTITGVPIEYLRGAKASVVRKSRSWGNIQEKYISDLVIPTLRLMGFKLKSKSVLEATDAYVSVLNIAVGYIKNRQRQNPKLSFQQIIDELNSGKIDGQSIQAAEKYQEDMNAPSNQNNAAKVLREDKNRVSYFMKGFPLATGKSFESAVKRMASNFFKKDLAKDASIENSQTASRYIVQQVLYRAASTYLLPIIAEQIVSLMGGESGDDDEYELEKKYWALGSGLFTDVFLSRYSVVVDIVFAIAVNRGYAMWAEGKLNEAKEKDPTFQSKALETDLLVEPRMGGFLSVLSGVYDKTLSFYKKEYELAKKSTEEFAVATSALKALLREVAPILTGSGTVRYFSSRGNTIKKNELSKSMLIYGEMIGKYGYQYRLDDGDMKTLVDEFKNTKPSEIKQRIVFKEDDINPAIYVISKDMLNKARAQAILDLYKISNQNYSDIIKSSKFENELKGAKIDESQKIKEAEKQIKAKTNEILKKKVALEDSRIKKYVLVK